MDPVKETPQQQGQQPQQPAPEEAQKPPVDYYPRGMLGDVQTAMQSVLVGGQSYKIGTRSLTRADLSLLRDLWNDLRAQTAAEDQNKHLLADTYVAVFEGR